jgi:predicted transcriptional regulator
MPADRAETALSVVRWHQRREVAPPVDVYAIARDLGIEVRRRLMSADTSGLIERSPERGGPSGFAIAVNALHSPKRQRFTVAHEIAHFILHRDLIGPRGEVVDDAMYRSSLSDTLERQANRLAAEILMPAQLIRELYQDGNHSPEALARDFDVSQQAMEIRMAELNLRQYSLF